MRRLEGKVAIITGGAGGIGSVTCERFASEGATVVVADIVDDAARAVAERIGGGAIGLHMDCADPASVEQAIEETVVRFGKLDVLFNNAALISANADDLDAIDTTIETWDNIMQVNARGVFLGCKYAIPHLIRNGGGSIINASSASAARGDRVRIAYQASKAAVSALTRAVAAGHGHQNIRCNAILPGLMVQDTIANLYPDLMRTFKRHVLMPRHGRPSDIAAMAAFLAADESEFITAQCYMIDGGTFSHMPHMADLADMESGQV